MAIAVQIGDRLSFMPISSMTGLGGAATIWDAALRNAENLTGLQVIREQLDPDRSDTAIVTLKANDRFVASRLAIPHWLRMNSSDPHRPRRW